MACVRCGDPACEGCGLTRRKFFFLSGLAGLFVATRGLEGLVLAERDVIRIPKRVIYARIRIPAAVIAGSAAKTAAERQLFEALLRKEASAWDAWRSSAKWRA